MRRLATRTNRLLIVVYTVTLAVAVGALGDLPDWEAPSWWWSQSSVGALTFYIVVVLIAGVAGWLLKESFSELARYDRFDHYGIEYVRRCDVLVLPLAQLNEKSHKDKAITFARDSEPLSEHDLDELAERFRDTSLEVGWRLFSSLLARGFTPDLVLLRGTLEGKPPADGETDLTLLPVFRHIEAKGLKRADGTRYTPTVHPVEVKPRDLKSCFDGLRRQLERLGGRSVIMDVTSATGAMSVACAMLGIANGQLLASTEKATPTVFYDARIRLVSPFTAMSGS